MWSQLQDSGNCESPRIPLKKAFLFHNAQLSSTNKSSHREYKYFTTLHILHPTIQTSNNKRFERQLGRIRYVRNFDIPDELNLNHFKKSAQQIQHFSKTTRACSNSMSNIFSKDQSFETVPLVHKKTFKWVTIISESQLHHDVPLQSLKYQENRHTLKLKIVGPEERDNALNSFLKVGASLKRLVSLEISAYYFPLFCYFFEAIRKLPHLKELIVKSYEMPKSLKFCNFEEIALKKLVFFQTGRSEMKPFILENLSRAVHLDEIDIQTTSHWGWNFMSDYESEGQLKKFLESHGYQDIRTIPRPRKKREFHFKDSRVTLIVSNQRFYLKKHWNSINLTSVRDLSGSVEIESV